MPRAGRWLEEAGGSRSDGSNNVQDLSTMGHVVVGQVTLSQRQPLVTCWKVKQILEKRQFLGPGGSGKVERRLLLTRMNAVRTRVARIAK